MSLLVFFFLGACGCIRRVRKNAAYSHIFNGALNFLSAPRSYGDDSFGEQQSSPDVMSGRVQLESLAARGSFSCFNDPTGDYSGDASVQDDFEGTLAAAAESCSLVIAPSAPPLERVRRLCPRPAQTFHFSFRRL